MATPYMHAAYVSALQDESDTYFVPGRRSQSTNRLPTTGKPSETSKSSSLLRTRKHQMLTAAQQDAKRNDDLMDSRLASSAKTT